MTAMTQPDEWLAITITQLCHKSLSSGSDKD